MTDRFKRFFGGPGPLVFLAAAAAIFLLAVLTNGMEPGSRALLVLAIVVPVVLTVHNIRSPKKRGDEPARREEEGPRG